MMDDVEVYDDMLMCCVVMLCCDVMFRSFVDIVEMCCG